jgi:hypothetical protein
MTQSLETALDTYQLWQHIGGYVLVAGLVGELLAIVFLRNETKSEKVCSIIATAVILLGVGIENIAGSRADDVVRKMRAPRSLTIAQQSAIAEKLKSFGPSHEAVFFEVSDVDPEIAGITADLGKAAALAGWKSGIEGIPPTPPLWLRAPDKGILILISPVAPDKSVLPAAQVLVSMLLEYGLAARLSQGYVGSSPPLDNRIKVVVYVK